MSQLLNTFKLRFLEEEKPQDNNINLYVITTITLSCILGAYIWYHKSGIQPRTVKIRNTVSYQPSTQTPATNDRKSQVLQPEHKITPQTIVENTSIVSEKKIIDNHVQSKHWPQRMSTTLSNAHKDAVRRVEELESLLQSQKEQYENQIRVLTHKISKLEASVTQPKSPHSFQVQTSLAPSTCGVCSSLIFAFPKSSACVCECCKFVAHAKCAPFAPPTCKQANLRTSIHRPDVGTDIKEITETALKTPEKSGYLYKKGFVFVFPTDNVGESHRRWKKYYFALAKNNLFYFKDTASNVPKDIINLTDALIHIVVPNQPGAATSRKHAFVIHTKEKSLVLSAQNATELSQWTQRLTQVVQQAAEKRAEVVLERFKMSSTNTTTNESVGFQWDSILHIKMELPSIGNLLSKNKKLSLDVRLREEFGIASSPNNNNDIQELLDDEAYFFRLKNACLVSTMGIDKFQLLTAAVTPAPLPQDFPDKFFVSYRYSSTLTKAVECGSFESVKASFCKFLNSQSQMVLLGINVNLIHRYLLKLVGFEEFVPIDDSLAMSSLVFVRNCIKKRKKIEFLIVDMDLVLDQSTRVDTIMIKGAFKQKFTHRVFDTRNIQGMSRKMVQVYPASEVHKPFEIRVVCLHTFDKSVLYNHFDKNDVDGGKVVLFVEAAIYFGSEILGTTMYTRPIPASLTELPLWCDWLRSKVLLSSIPREARLSLTLFACREISDKISPTEYWMTATKQGVALAWVNTPICDYRGVLHQELYLGMWYPGRARPTASCMQNIQDDKFKLVIEFLEAPRRIAFLPFETNQNNNNNNTDRSPSQSDILRIEQLISTDPIRVLNDEEKMLLWNNRHLVSTYPQGLSKFILSAPWTLPTCRRDIWALIDLVGDQLSSLDALELLDSNFPHTEVREFAVNRLNLLSDLDLIQFLPQLVQVLVFENYHASALAEFLIYRALKNQKLVGHYLFWRLKSELHSIHTAARFRLMLEAYLITCGQQYREALLKQVRLMEQLTKIAEQVKYATTNKKTEVLQSELKNLNLPPKFKIPLFPSLELSGIDIESCRWMDSATYPLWLVFGNTDSFGRKVSVIFKVGDDLRQDMLTLQIIRILDNLWKEEGLDLHLTTYGCIATGKGVGLIEVVSDSKTTADIHKKEGAVTGAFKKTSLANWLQQYNPTPEEYSNAVNNFTYSCAAYSVVTYTLGIADRHNDNVMLTTDGHLFHIDFGHFLGNYLKFGAFKRETAPFTLTPEMAYVMGGEKGDMFSKYVEYCTISYNIVRKHSNMLLTLFAMMTGSGLPQLQKFEDIYYLREALKLNKTEQQAADHFQQLIKEALGTQRTVLNNAIHMLVHPN